MHGSVWSLFIEFLPEHEHLDEQNNAVDAFSNTKLNNPKVVFTWKVFAHDDTDNEIGNTQD